jgi:uncharacterized DUF497 family protein
MSILENSAAIGRFQSGQLTQPAIRILTLTGLRKDAVRLISARRATRQEEKAYEE